MDKLEEQNIVCTAMGDILDALRERLVGYIGETNERQLQAIDAWLFERGLCIKEVLPGGKLIIGDLRETEVRL